MDNYTIFLTHQEMKNFYENTKEIPFELFMSAMAMLIERRCYEENKDVIEQMTNMLNCAEKINEELGETDWHD